MTEEKWPAGVHRVDRLRYDGLNWEVVDRLFYSSLRDAQRYNRNEVPRCRNPDAPGCIVVVDLSADMVVECWPD